jgi:predicted amidohydrolase
MIEPYQAVGLIPAFWGVRTRADIAKNLDHLEELTRAAIWLGGLDLPVRLLAIPEGALQGFNDEALDLDHETFAREVAIDIPGPETERLGALAREHDVYVIAQAKARHASFPGRYFNVGFVIDPAGQVILRHHKVVPLLPCEHSLTPHNVWDRWVELYGETLDAFYPVVDTEIGRIGIMMANEGSYPENARGLAMNGAEILYRGPLPNRSSDAIEIQNRARSLDNNVYVLAPNVGDYYLFPDSETPVDAGGGRSMITDYLGRIVGDYTFAGTSSWVAAPIDVEALRHHRVSARWGNWMKDLTTEQYRLIYDEPVYPRNLYLDRAPYTHAEYQAEVIEPNVRRLVDRGVYALPGGRPLESPTTEGAQHADA